MEERRATIEQKVALAFAVRLPQSCPDIHTHARRGRLRFEDGAVRACRSRGPAIRACERLAFPSPQREEVIASRTSTNSRLSRERARWDLSAVVDQGRCAGTIWPVQNCL